jgi:hypothetical protein
MHNTGHHAAFCRSRPGLTTGTDMPTSVGAGQGQTDALPLTSADVQISQLYRTYCLELVRLAIHLVDDRLLNGFRCACEWDGRQCELAADHDDPAHACAGYEHSGVALLRWDERWCWAEPYDPALEGHRRSAA